MSNFVKPSRVYFDVPATTVDEVLEFLSKKAVESGIADDAAAVLEGFKTREAQGTTGMQAGFAIPHCKCAAVKDAAICAVKFAGDVEWESMDGKPIKMAVALLIPDGEAGTTHLRLLSQLAVLLMDESFREKALAADDAVTVAALINAGIE